MQKSSDYSTLTMRIYSRHEAIIRRLVCRGIDFDDASDLAMEIVIDAVEAINQLKNSNKLDAWLGTITENSIKRYYRNKAKKQRNEIPGYTWDDNGEENYIIEIISDTETVEEKIRCAEERHVLGGLLNRLNEKERSIFLMRNFYCCKFKDISKRLSINENTVKSINARCCKKMKQSWQEIFGENNF